MIASSPVSAPGFLGWLAALLAGAVSAACFGAGLAQTGTLLVLLAYASALPLFMVGFGYGAGATLVGAVGGGAALAFSGSLPAGVPEAYALIVAAPVALAVALALRARTGEDGGLYWYPEGRLLTALAGYAGAAFLAVFLAFIGHESGGFLEFSALVVKQTVEAMAKEASPDQALQILQAFEGLPRYLPSILGSSWFFFMLISALCAEAVLKRQGWLIRAPFRFAALEAPWGLVPFVAVTGLAGLFAPAPWDYLGANLCVLACLPLFMAGLAVVHIWAAARMRAPVAVLILFYVVLSILPWLAVLVTLLGVVDCGLGLRRRWLTPSSHPLV